jgi:hypothetical protein
MFQVGPRYGMRQYENNQSVSASSNSKSFSLESPFISLAFRILIKVSTGRQRC